MKVMVVSDVHWEMKSHKGVWEGEAFSWLQKMIRSTVPQELVGLGDWGHAWQPQSWDDLSGILPVQAIYGNHENLAVLQSAKNRTGNLICARDGEIRNIGRFRLGFINGIVALAGHKKIKDGVPRQSPEEYLGAARKLVGVDFLATHESPYLPVYGDRIHHPALGLDTVEEAIRIASPRVSFSGHLSGPYSIGRIANTIIVRVDSSQAERHYAILEGKTVSIYRDHDKVDEVSF